MNRTEIVRLFKQSFREWLNDNAILRAAALTFFIILPLPTLLLIAVGIFSLFFGETAAIQIVILQISSVVGPAVAGLFNQLLLNTGSPFNSIWTAIVVVGFSLGGAIGAFSVLRDSMDCIWEVRLPKMQPLWKRVRQKIGPFVLVSALGLIVIAWTAIASSLSSVIAFLSVNGTLTLITVTTIQIVLSFLLVTLLLAIIYKMIPEARVHWRDVTLASVTTGIAFTVTNYIFGTYIQVFTVTTVSGAGGALVIILLWIFVLNQLVLFGAEVSKLYVITIGAHAILHLATPLERFVLPLERVGEKIEQATKDEFETDEKPQHTKE